MFRLKLEVQSDDAQHMGSLRWLPWIIASAVIILALAAKYGAHVMVYLCK